MESAGAKHDLIRNVFDSEEESENIQHKRDSLQYSSDLSTLPQRSRQQWQRRLQMRPRSRGQRNCCREGRTVLGRGGRPLHGQD